MTFGSKLLNLENINVKKGIFSLGQYLIFYGGGWINYCNRILYDFLTI